MTETTGEPQGLCDTTLTERFSNPKCICDTSVYNLGPCKGYLEGANGQCVYCDHTEPCHDKSKAVDLPQTASPRMTIHGFIFEMFWNKFEKNWCWRCING